jgi:hypothetical protein
LTVEEVMQVKRIVDTPVARLRQTKPSLEAASVITASLFIALFIPSAPVLGDTLVVGSVYFDSEQTLNEVIQLSSQHDNEGIAQLIKSGHISDPTREEQDVVILTSPSTPETPTEFRFFNGPTTFWTLAKNVANFPTPIPAPTIESTPLPKQSSTPSSKQPIQQKENHAGFNDHSDKRIWHQVDGKWKRHPASNRVTSWPAATLPGPSASPRVSPSPLGTPPASNPRPTPTPLIMNEGTNLYNSDRTQPFKNYRKPAGQ